MRSGSSVSFTPSMTSARSSTSVDVALRTTERMRRAMLTVRRGCDVSSVFQNWSGSNFSELVRFSELDRFKNASPGRRGPAIPDAALSRRADDVAVDFKVVVALEKRQRQRLCQFGGRPASAHGAPHEPIPFDDPRDELQPGQSVGVVFRFRKLVKGRSGCVWIRFDLVVLPVDDKVAPPHAKIETKRLLARIRKVAGPQTLNERAGVGRDVLLRHVGEK
mmetsp:Transcript_19871/g.68470  ORF Transcript_19871/g.68470 Transcript_19871/m.68470 type:complete len:220 (-) Transcript_19871:1498-2157(-)